MRDDVNYVADQIQFWNNWCPVKVNFLSWRLYCNRLPTKAALSRRNIHLPSTTCVLFGDYEETTDHLFASCRLVQQVWDEISRWCRNPTPFLFSAKDVLELHLHCRGLAKWKRALYSVVQTCIWCIWQARNEATFDYKRMSVERVVEEVKVLGYLWLKHRYEGKHAYMESLANV
ncbi:uncharacterized protein LOC110870477 [Helianthus annuus]|uniref:uncharacterized protein LOC110870477 n=1 Tax=Helianthus annuus TaxID=4232 RepID=UPI000B8F1B23|nr:uncharacterized protein LOC110870477 [Helianthus annuus]